MQLNKEAKEKNKSKRLVETDSFFAQTNQESQNQKPKKESKETKERSNVLHNSVCIRYCITCFFIDSCDL